MPGRTLSSEQYRYGYQGSERDPEMFPKNRDRLGGAGYTTFFRALDPRIGRWLTPDPKVFPWQSPYVSMDGNPVALVDPWGASTEGGEKGGAQKHADDYKTETGRSYSTDPSGGYVFEGVDVSPPAAIANTPVNRAFANDATKVAQQFISDMGNSQRMQTAIDYDQGLSFLEKASAFLRGLSNGGGDYTNWDVSGGWQICSTGDGGL